MKQNYRRCSGMVEPSPPPDQALAYGAASALEAPYRKWPDGEHSAGKTILMST